MPIPARRSVSRSLAAALSSALLLAACGDDDGADVRDLGGDGSASVSGSAPASGSGSASASASAPATEGGSASASASAPAGGTEAETEAPAGG